MTRPTTTITFLVLLVAIAVGVFAWTMAPADPAGEAQGAKEPAARGPQPVDDDMHHFMEYVFEPNYKRLKALMAEEAKDRSDWKALKGDSLTLAECANLLLLRGPEEDADRWRALSVAVRTHGGELYQAARKTDDAAAHTAYVNMLKNCNACHKQFADGKHQLER